MITPAEFIDPKGIEIDGAQFTVSRLPAWDAAPIYDDIVKAGGVIPQDCKLALLSRCSVKTDKGEVVLDKPILINTYVKKFSALQKLINEAFDLNFDFSESGSPSQE